MYRQDAVAVVISPLPAAQRHGEAEHEEASAGLRVEEEMVREELVGGLQAARWDDGIQVPVDGQASHVTGSGGISQDLGSKGDASHRGYPCLKPAGMDSGWSLRANLLSTTPCSPLPAVLQPFEQHPSMDLVPQHGFGTSLGAVLRGWDTGLSPPGSAAAWASLHTPLGLSSPAAVEAQKGQA